MSDLEMVRLCAEAMKLEWRDCPELTMNGQPTIQTKEQRRDYHEWRLYDPLKRDAQAMALVKRFGLRMHVHNCIWTVIAGKSMEQTIVAEGSSSDLNHAIVECVAKMGASINDPN